MFPAEYHCDRDGGQQYFLWEFLYEWPWHWVKNPRSPDQCVGVDAAVGILGVSIDVNPFVSGQGEGPDESCQT